MTVDRRWSAFWIVPALEAVGGEIAALFVDGSRDSLSAQVWFVLDLSPVAKAGALAVFGAGAAWLTVHFFGRRG